MQPDPLEVSEENAVKLAHWLTARGGLLVWESHDLGNPGKSFTTPAKSVDGGDTPSPGWQFPTPTRHITSPDDVKVVSTKVVDTFPVKLKAKGMRIVLTDGSSRKVREKLAKVVSKRADGDASYRFKSTGSASGSTPHGLTYGEDVVEIYVSDKVVSLREFAATNNIPL